MKPPYQVHASQEVIDSYSVDYLREIVSRHRDSGKESSIFNDFGDDILLETCESRSTITIRLDRE